MKKGIYSAVLTPFKRDLSIDKKLFIGHCEYLVKNNINLAPLGTTGEASSISTNEKIDLIKILSKSDLPKNRIMIGTGNSSYADAAFLTSESIKKKIYSVLVLPPFYYKNVSDEGIYQYYKNIIDEVKSKNLRLFLYNIPQVSGVAISVNLIQRLKKKYSDIIAGIKDSSGDFENIKLYKNIKSFIVYPGSEKFLMDGLSIGCSGCISATTNVNIQAAKLIKLYNLPEGEKLNQKVLSVRSIFEKFPVIAALKAIKFKENENWMYIRPPLISLNIQQRNDLIKDLRNINFL